MYLARVVLSHDGCVICYDVIISLHTLKPSTFYYISDLGYFAIQQFEYHFCSNNEKL